MRVVVYVRVSTDRQAESGLGLRDQIDKCRAFCQAYGHQIVEETRDEGASAGSLDRPGLKRAMALLDSGEAEGVVVAKLDRLTRSLPDLVALLDGPFKRSALMSVGETLDTSTAAGRMMVSILGVIAQWERETIQERVKAAMHVRKAQGRQAAGVAAYGYMWGASRTIVPNPQEQAIIARLLELRDVDKLDWTRCADALNRARLYRRPGRNGNPTWWTAWLASRTYRAAKGHK